MRRKESVLHKFQNYRLLFMFYGRVERMTVYKKPRSCCQRIQRDTIPMPRMTIFE